MPTQVVKIDRERGYSETINRGAQVLRSGGLVGFPTETVYGLAARADIEPAVRRLRSAKGRDDGKPFTVHIGRLSDLDRFVGDVPAVVRRLARKAWPGPLTLLLEVRHPERTPVSAEFGRQVTEQIYHDGTVGLRCPDDRTAADLLNEAGPPVVATSANVSGQRPPRTAEEVLQQMDGQIDLLIDGGPTRYATASTIVRVHTSPRAPRSDGAELGATPFSIVREGVYDARALRRLSAMSILFVCAGNTCRSPMAVGLCRRLLAEKLGWAPQELEGRGYQLASAGLTALTGGRAAAEAIGILRERGVDISRHSTQPLTGDLVRHADWILAMTRAQLEAIGDLAPEAADRVALLAGDTDIEDPVGSGAEVYAACADRLEAALRRRLAELEL